MVQNLFDFDFRRRYSFIINFRDGKMRVFAKETAGDDTFEELPVVDEDGKTKIYFNVYLPEDTMPIKGMSTLVNLMLANPSPRLVSWFKTCTVGFEIVDRRVRLVFYKDGCRIGNVRLKSY